MNRLWVVLCAVVMVGGCVDGAATEPNVRPRDAQRAILDAFDDHQVVGGFSASHGNKDVDDFLLDLVRNPDLPATVDDIVIECGNAFHQDLLDDYVNGADVDVRPVWRTTSQPECGFSVFVEQLVPLVRRINEGLPDDRRLRVLAADPPLDWSRIDSVEELERLSDRDGFAASLMADEVLARGRKALMFFGINHMRHRPGTLVGQYEARGYDGLTYVIDDHQGFGNQDPGLRRRNDELEDRMADWPVPSVIEIENTWLADLDAPYFNDPLPGDDQGKGNPGVDGYLFVGRRDGLLREGRSAQAMTDETYLAQLDDIADRLGEPADSPWRTVRRREASEGVFLYEPGR